MDGDNKKKAENQEQTYEYWNGLVETDRRALR